MQPSREWFEQEDEDLTLTRRMPNEMPWRSREEQTDIVLHPSFAALPLAEEVEAEPVAPAYAYLSGDRRAVVGDVGRELRYSEYGVMPEPRYESQPAPYYAVPFAPPTEALGSAPSQADPPAYAYTPAPPAPFTPRMAEPRSLPELSYPRARARLDSDTSITTWKKTMPALRRMIGLPVIPGYVPETRLAPEPAQRSRSTLSPALSIAMAVCLVAMVVMSIVGFGSRQRLASREAQIRVVSAISATGESISDGRVFVDGAEECASTPCELELTSGVHWINVRAAGYESPSSRATHVGSDEETELRFELQPSRVAAPAAAPAPSPEPVVAPPPAAAPALADVAAKLPAEAPAPKPAPIAPAQASFGGVSARLNLNSIPSANVVLDGRPVGHTPLLGLKVKPGDHTVVFIAADGSRAVRSARVAPGRSATVAARL
ncbi:MAG: PEGA domain-containing protein [Polyangiaceae bacterium]